MANMKNWDNLAIELTQEMLNRDHQLSVDSIEDLVSWGLPKLTGLRWLKAKHPDDKYAKAVRRRWERDLLKDGVPERDVYL